MKLEFLLFFQSSGAADKNSFCRWSEIRKILRVLLAETIDLCEDYFLVHFFGAKIFDYVTSFFLACAALRKLHVLKDHLSNSGLKNYLKTVRKSLPSLCYCTALLQQTIIFNATFFDRNQCSK